MWNQAGNIIIVTLVLFFISCESKNDRHKKAVESLIGKEIRIPENAECQIQDIPFDYDFDDADYKIITYIDSAGCTSCNMKLASRNASIDEFKTLEDIEVNYLLIINSKNKEEIIRLLKMGEFNHPVMIDTEGEFIRYNEMPEESAYHTILLDNSNRILAVGDPVKNPKIKELYRNIITESQKEENNEKLSLASHPTKNLGMVNKGDTVHVSFQMINEDSVTYHIQDIIPSCDCVKVESESTVISPDGRNNIGIRFATDTIGTTFSKYIEIFYEETEKPERLTVYGYMR